jgi:hypothetical protein
MAANVADITPLGSATVGMDVALLRDLHVNCPRFLRSGHACCGDSLLKVYTLVLSMVVQGKVPLVFFMSHPASRGQNRFYPAI